jgi:hypothetical protein
MRRRHRPLPRRRAHASMAWPAWRLTVERWLSSRFAADGMAVAPARLVAGNIVKNETGFLKKQHAKGLAAPKVAAGVVHRRVK